MKYTKVTFAERSHARYNDFHVKDGYEDGFEKFGNLNLDDIKTLYAEEKHSWPVPTEDLGQDVFPTEEAYFEALSGMECDHGFAGVVYGIETKSGDYIDMRETPILLDIETPYNTLDRAEVENKEELFAKMDGDLVAESLTDLETNQLQQ